MPNYIANFNINIAKSNSKLYNALNRTATLSTLRGNAEPWRFFYALLSCTKPELNSDQLSP